VLPWILKAGAVGIGLREITVLEKGLIKVRVHDL
jgi:hypothetical protein